MTTSDGQLPLPDPDTPTPTRPAPAPPEVGRPWSADLRGSAPPVLVQVRRWLGNELADLDNPHLMDVLIVAVELLENAYYHGHGPREIRVRWQRSPCQVRVEVEDHNPDPPRLAQPGLRGRGMVLVQQIVEDWGTEPAVHGEGKTVWALIACEGESQTPCQRSLVDAVTARS